MTPLIAGLGLALSIGSEYGQTRRAREQGRIQSGFMQDALKDLGLAEQSLKDSIGSSLALPTLEAERALDAVSESGEMAMEQLSDRQDAISQATGFANIGMDEDSIKNIRKQFERKREDIDIALTKNLSNVLSQFEQQKFEMQSQRRQLEMQKRMADQQSNTKYFGIFG
jgi:DNA primase